MSQNYEAVFRWKASLPAEPNFTLRRSSITVLPFENFGLERRSRPLLGGLTEEIINALVQVEGLIRTPHGRALAPHLH